MKSTEKRKKRVLVFSLVYYPRLIGGSEVAIKEIAGGTEDDFEFDLITLWTEPQKQEQIHGINVHRVGVRYVPDPNKSKLDKYFFPFLAALKAVRLHKKRNYDFTWSMMANYAGFGALFFKLMKPKIPFLLTLQEGDPISYIKRKVWFVYPLFRRIFVKADRIQAISRFLADFGKHMGHKKPIDLIPNGVDIKLFSQVFTDAEKQKMKEKLGKDKEDIFLVTTSRLVRKNATEDTISALTHLPSHIKFVVIGIGPDYRALKKQVKDLNLENRVIFSGFVPYEKIPEYFSVCDIFVRPSRSEGFGNSFIEAMAAHLPVIATPVGGIVDFIDDKQTGVFCSPDNPKSIAAAVKLILDDPQLKDRIIKNGYTRAKDKYSWEQVVKSMRGVFKSISSKTTYENFN